MEIYILIYALGFVFATFFLDAPPIISLLWPIWLAIFVLFLIRYLITGEEVGIFSKDADYRGPPHRRKK